MDRDEVIARVRALRAKGVSPKAIARTVGLPPAQVTPLIRAVAAESEASAPQPAVLECWVSSGWSRGLAVEGHPEWRDSPNIESAASGLASVVVACEALRGRVSVCGYLVDVYCLGVKNALGPRVMDRHAVPGFVSDFYRSYEAPPVAASLELAQHLVFGAIDYARGLGFEPHPDFAAAAAHLGVWTGPSAITFGENGKPMYVQGPNDDAARVMRTLERTVGKGNFHFLIEAGGAHGYRIPS